MSNTHLCILMELPMANLVHFRPPINSQAPQAFE